MNVRSVHLRNFRSYERLDLELPDGATALIGANGAGKSSILAAVDVALFGARSLEPYLRRGADRLEVSVWVDHGSDLHLIRRTFAGGKSTLDFERAIIVSRDPWGSAREPLTLETQKATQERIEAALGLTRATFRASAYLAQGDAAALTSARPAERMEILRATLGGLGLFDLAHERAKALLRDAGSERVELEAEASVLRLAIERLSSSVEEERDLARAIEGARDAVVLAETERDKATGFLREVLAHDAELRVLEGQLREAELSLAAFEAQADDFHEAQLELETERRRLEALEHETADLPRLEEEEAALTGEMHAAMQRSETRAVAQQARDEAGQRQDRLRALAEEQRQLAATTREEALRDGKSGPDTTRCRECKQLLGREALEQSVITRREAADDLERMAADFEEQAAAIVLPEVPPPTGFEAPRLAAAREALQGARDAQLRLAGVRALIEQLERVKPPDTIDHEAAARAAQDAREAATFAATTLEGLDLEGLERDVGHAEEVLRHEQWVLSDRERLHAVATHRLSELRRCEFSLEVSLEAMDKAETEGRLLEPVAAMFAPTGIPLLIIENAIPLIEQRAQEVLERLGGETAGCQIELRTQRELKTSDALRDTLDIVIHAADGSELAYEHWSGGEKMRLDLAVRIGLAQLLLTHGANVELFAVDEPDGLDAQGRAALVEVIEAMRDRYGFRKVILISHDDGLRDSLPQTLEVSRDGDAGSVVAGAMSEAA